MFINKLTKINGIFGIGFPTKMIKIDDFNDVQSFLAIFSFSNLCNVYSCCNLCNALFLNN